MVDLKGANMKKKSRGLTGKISRKIMLAIIATNLILAILIAGVVGFLINQNVSEESRNKASDQVQGYVNQFQQEFSNIESAVSIMVNEIKADVDVQRAMRDKQYLQDYKKDLVKRYALMGENTDLTRSIYAYFNTDMFKQEVDIWMLEMDDGSFELQDSFGMDYYDEYHEWYNEPIDNQKTLWTFPYESAAGGYITSYVTPVIVDGKAIAMVGMDLYLDDVQKTLDDVRLFETGYLYMIHPDGRTIVHPTVELGTNMLEVGNFESLLKEFNSKESGFTTYKRQDGAGVLSAFSHLNNGWIVASSIPENEVLALLQMILMFLGGITLAALIIAAFMSNLVGNGISKPILKVVDATERIKNGDFTVQVEVKTKDETLDLASSLNDMTRTVRGLIQETSGVSREMLDAASTLASMAEETNATVDQVATTVQEIATGTQDLARDGENGAHVAHEIDVKFNSLMTNSQAMKEKAGVAKATNEAGLEVLENLKEKSSISQASNVKVVGAVESLEERANAITNIIGTIASIADQTNLLALNASIEAARAGEAGRGFAVVADEIRKLAEDSGKATSEIRDIVLSIQQESKDTVAIMNEVNEISSEQNEAVTNVTKAFNSINESVDGITSIIEVVTSELNGLSDNKNEIVNVVNNISSVSEETAAATEQVSYSMDEQTKAIEEVARNAERLNELSAELNKQIEVFKV